MYLTYYSSTTTSTEDEDEPVRGKRNSKVKYCIFIKNVSKILKLTISNFFFFKKFRVAKCRSPWNLQSLIVRIFFSIFLKNFRKQYLFLIFPGKSRRLDSSTDTATGSSSEASEGSKATTKKRSRK